MTFFGVLDVEAFITVSRFPVHGVDQSSKSRAQSCFSNRAKEHVRDAKNLESLNRQSCSPNAHRYAKSQLCPQPANRKRVQVKHGPSKLSSEHVHRILELEFLFTNKSSNHHLSPIPTIPIRRRHQPFPRPLRLILQQLPLHIPTFDINKRHQPTPNHDRKAHQNQINW